MTDSYIPWDVMLSDDVDTSSVCDDLSKITGKDLKKAMSLAKSASYRGTKQESCLILAKHMAGKVLKAINASSDPVKAKKIVVTYLTNRMKSDSVDDKLEVPIMLSGQPLIEEKKEERAKSPVRAKTPERTKSPVRAKTPDRAKSPEPVQFKIPVTKAGLVAELKKRKWPGVINKADSTIGVQYTIPILKAALTKLMSEESKPEKKVKPPSDEKILELAANEYIKQHFPNANREDFAKQFSKDHPDLFDDTEIKETFSDLYKDLALELKGKSEAEKQRIVEKIAPEIEKVPVEIPRIIIPSIVNIEKKEVRPDIFEFIERKGWKGLADKSSKEDVCDFVFNNIIDEEKEMDIKYSQLQEQFRIVNSELIETRAQLRQSIADLNAARRTRSAKRVSEIRDIAIDLKDKAVAQSGLLEQIETQLKTIESSRRDHTESCHTMQQWLTQDPMSPREIANDLSCSKPEQACDLSSNKCVDVDPEEVEPVIIRMKDSELIIPITDSSAAMNINMSVQEKLQEVVCNTKTEYLSEQEAFDDLECKEGVCDVVQKKCISDADTIDMRVENIEIGDKMVRVTGKQAYQNIEQIKDKLRKLKQEDKEEDSKEEEVFAPRKKLYDSKVPDVQDISKTLQMITNAKPVITIKPKGQTVAQQRIQQAQIKAKAQVAKCLNL